VVDGKGLRGKWVYPECLIELGRSNTSSLVVVAALSGLGFQSPSSRKAASSQTRDTRFSTLFKGLARDPKIPSCIY
jgi:hypothetical protein